MNISNTNRHVLHVIAPHALPILHFVLTDLIIRQSDRAPGVIGANCVVRCCDMSGKVTASPWTSGVSAVAPPVSPKPPKVVRLPLETSRDLHKALARLIRSAMAGKIETADLGRYANAIATLHKIITDGELAAIEARLATLEGRAA